VHFVGSYYLCVSQSTVKSCTQVCTVAVVLCYVISKPWRRKSGGAALRIYDLGSWWRGVMSFGSRPLYHYLQGNGPTIPTAQEAGWAPVSIGLGAVTSEFVALVGHQTPIIRSPTLAGQTLQTELRLLTLHIMFIIIYQRVEGTYVGRTSIQIYCLELCTTVPAV